MTNRHGSKRRRRLASARLYLIAGGPETAGEELDSSRPRADWIDPIVAAVRGGVDLVQIRWKGAATVDVVQALAELKSALAGSEALIVVNDDLEAARDADGVHLGQEDAPYPAARERLGEGALIGISTHSRAEALAAQSMGADYIGCGAMFETTTKRDTRRRGPALLEEVTPVVSIPVFAIGGIDAGNVDAIVRAGGRRIAVSSAILQSPDPERAARELKARLGT